MRPLFSIAALLSLLPIAATSQSTIARCAAVSADAARLACYDSIAKRLPDSRVLVGPGKSLPIPDRPTDPHPGIVFSGYDRFTDAVQAELKDLPIPGSGIQLHGLYSMPGRTPSRAATVSLLFTSTSKDWQYLRCHHLQFMVDGTPLKAPESQHDGSVSVGAVFEIVTLRVTADWLITVSNASKVEGRLCNTEFVLNKPELTALRDFVSMMK